MPEKQPALYGIGKLGRVMGLFSAIVAFRDVENGNDGACCPSCGTVGRIHGFQVAFWFWGRQD